MRRCVQCGHENPENQTRCAKCSCSLQPLTPVSPSVSFAHKSIQNSIFGDAEDEEATCFSFDGNTHFSLGTNATGLETAESNHLTDGIDLQANLHSMHQARNLTGSLADPLLEEHPSEDELVTVFHSPSSKPVMDDSKTEFLIPNRSSSNLHLNDALDTSELETILRRNDLPLSPQSSPHIDGSIHQDNRPSISQTNSSRRYSSEKISFPNVSASHSSETIAFIPDELEINQSHTVFSHHTNIKNNLFNQDDISEYTSSSRIHSYDTQEGEGQDSTSGETNDPPLSPLNNTPHDSLNPQGQIQDPDPPTMMGVSLAKLSTQQFTLGDYTNPMLNITSPTPNRGVEITDLSELFIGQKFGNYLIQEQIGRGGFGSIYRANHIYLHQPVAVKVLHVNLQDDPEVLERFRREARALASIRHENVVTLSDFGLLPKLGFYLAMEYIEGESIHLRMKNQERFSLHRIKNIFRQLCLVLQQVHKKGIVHRDMKPSNLILSKSETNQGELLKLIDFGIASIQIEPLGLTREGTNIGTAKYMSPEQALGKPNLDGRSDLYSITTIMVKLFTGRLPFRGKSHAELIQQHVQSSPPTLASIAPWKKWHPLLEKFIQKSLAKDAEKRPLNAQDYWKLFKKAIDAQINLEKRQENKKTRLPKANQKAFSSWSRSLLLLSIVFLMAFGIGWFLF